MEVRTKLFGDIVVEEEKIIHFEKGIIGFPDMRDFTLLYDSSEEGDRSISWLQSVEEAALALPVVNPLLFHEGYSPVIEDEFLKPLGSCGDEDLLAFVTLTVPTDIEKMSVNLRAPIIINANTRKACQIIVETGDWPVKYPVYEKISGKNRKEGV